MPTQILDSEQSVRVPRHYHDLVLVSSLPLARLRPPPLKRDTLARKINLSHIMSSAAVDGDGATDSRAPDVVQLAAAEEAGNVQGDGSGDGGTGVKMHDSDADEEVLCRYCFEGPEEGEMLSGICACAGGQKHVHLDCLRRWQRMGRSEDTASPVQLNFLPFSAQLPPLLSSTCVPFSAQLTPSLWCEAVVCMGNHSSLVDTTYEYWYLQGAFMVVAPGV